MDESVINPEGVRSFSVVLSNSWLVGKCKNNQGKKEEEMKELRIIVAGSRNFNNFELLFEHIGKISTDYVERYLYELSRVCIVSGTARGADHLGELYAKRVGLHIYRFPADWDLYGKSADYRRNAEMAKFASEEGNIGVLIAFGDGKSRGTKHMIDLAKRYALDVHVVNY